MLGNPAGPQCLQTEGRGELTRTQEQAVSHGGRDGSDEATSEEGTARTPELLVGCFCLLAAVLPRFSCLEPGLGAQDWGTQPVTRRWNVTRRKGWAPEDSDHVQ